MNTHDDGPTREAWDLYWQHVEEVAESPFRYANRTRQECERLIAAVGKKPPEFAADVRRFRARGRR